MNDSPDLLLAARLLISRMCRFLATSFLTWVPWLQFPGPPCIQATGRVSCLVITVVKGTFVALLLVTPLNVLKFVLW